MQLRPHQEQALQSMLDNDKGQVIVPTGGGKTMCMIMDAVKQLEDYGTVVVCLLYTSPSPRDLTTSRMPSSA